jgi:hypothetical protein
LWNAWLVGSDPRVIKFHRILASSDGHIPDGLLKRERILLPYLYPWRSGHSRWCIAVHVAGRVEAPRL